MTEWHIKMNLRTNRNTSLSGLIDDLEGPLGDRLIGGIKESLPVYIVYSLYSL